MLNITANGCGMQMMYLNVDEIYASLYGVTTTDLNSSSPDLRVFERHLYLNKERLS